MARKIDQIVRRGPRTWLVRVFKAAIPKPKRPARDRSSSCTPCRPAPTAIGPASSLEPPLAARNVL